MTRVRALLLLSTIVTGSLVLPASSAIAELKLVEYATGLSRPTGMVQDPVDPTVQYVLEKFGRIVTLKNGAIQTEPLLDLSTVVWQDALGERGLLGLAFAPDYATSGRAYVFFSSLQGVGDSVLARFTRSATNPKVLDPATRFDLMWAPGERFIRAPAEMHKGGKLLFGPDGYLYVGIPSIADRMCRRCSARSFAST
jgi:glucose/arabinose dehydrogenase